MRHQQITNPREQDGRAAMRKLSDGMRAAHAARMWPEIDQWSADWRADDMPYVVECDRLTVHDLGEAFADAFHDRKRWCRERCDGVFSVEPIWCADEGRDTGRRFRFSDQMDAAFFRLSWC